MAIYPPHRFELNYELPAVFMHDPKAFFVLDGYDDYCLGGFDTGNEDNPMFMVYPRKTIAGLHFYCKIHYENDECEYAAEIDNIKRRRD